MFEGNLYENHEKITVVGAGKTGLAVVDFLDERKVDLFVTESNKLKSEIKNTFRKRGVKYEEDGHSRRALDTDLLVVSPGVPLDLDLIKRGRKMGIPVIGEIELAYRLSPTDRIVGVTGTNGKSTTVNLITELLKYGGERPVACGNIGKPFIEAIASLTPSDVAVVEVSSYQLQTTKRFKPKVAVLTNLEPDHLKRHGSFEKYRKIKLKIFENQQEEDYAVLNKKLNLEIENREPTRIEYEPSSPSRLKLTPHESDNVGAALTAANCILEGRSFNYPPVKPVRRGLNLPHRLESVSTIAGIEFVDDSKATNPAATIAAIEGLEKPTRILLGGKAKKASYDKLAERIQTSSVRATYLFGSAQPALAEILRKKGITDFENCSTLEKAVETAFEDSAPNEVVLLSPGCSSFDRFANFEERGEKFKETVKSLTN
ncbi:MAG: UDP-N-acetylmuramoyl-L-alanine--D-glutamate ligase [Candidatus Bipolaricaulia bacterium]